MNRRAARRSRVPIPFLLLLLAAAAFLGCGGGGGGGTDAGSPVETVAAPTLNPSPGTYTSAPFVTISTTTAGASIRYTTDGSTPTSTTGTEYTGPFRVDRSVTVKAIARHSGWKDSPMSSAGYTIVGTPGPAEVYSYSAANPNGPVETIDGKPVIRLFGTTWCPHAAYIGPVFDRVAREYAAAGKIVAFHWQLDTEDDALTSQVEAAVPALERAMFDEFSPNGSVPTIVIGGKYGRIGNAYEGWTEGLLWEEEDLRAAIDEVIRETSLLAPSVATLAAMSVTATGAVMTGSVNPNGRGTTVWFEWGTDEALSAPAATIAQSVGSGNLDVAVNSALTMLTDNTTYYYRAVGVNSVDTVRGEIRSFTTNVTAPAAPLDNSDLWTGTSGVTYFGQSFNETRAVTVTVLSATDRVVEKITLEGLHAAGAGSVLVGARVYDNVTNALIASNNVAVAGGGDISVAVPVSVTLASGRSYRVGFYVQTSPLWEASGDMFWPSSFTGLYDQNPYVESSGIFRVNSAHATGSDSFPTVPNMAVPHMIIGTRTP